MSKFRAALAAFIMVAVSAAIVVGVELRPQPAYGDDPVTITTDPAPAPPEVTTTTIDPAAIDAFLVAWSDADKAAAFEVFEVERLRLETEAAEARRQAEAQAAAEAEAAAARVATPAPEAAPVAEQGTGRCGGDLPPCYVMMRESGGDIRAKNPTSTASGKWQVLDSTWQGYGGYAKARYAPESVQDDFARQLWAGGRGCAHWSAC